MLAKKAVITSVGLQQSLAFPEGENSHVPDRYLDIGQRLSDLLKRDLTFKGEKTSYASHNIHAFAAKFPPQLPRTFIQELTRPGEYVLDPMSGSGTTLIEAVF